MLYKILLPVLALLMAMPATPSFGQSPQEALPIWEASVGSRKHTSRDESQHIRGCRDGNLVVVGKVERDSTFSDILVQKFTPDGAQLWQLRYSSGVSQDYDAPLAVLLDSQDDLYIVGYTSSPYLQEGYAYLIKVSKNGALLWGNHFFKGLPGHQFFNHCMAAFDKNEQVHLCYSPYTAVDANTYFFRFSKEGQIVSQFFKNEIGIGTGSGWPTVVSYAVGPDDKFVFVIADYDNGYKYLFRKIDEHTDDLYSIDPSGLPPDQLTNYKNYMDWTQLRVDRSGNLYGATNFSQFGYDSRVFIAKVNPDGKVRYAIEPFKDKPVTRLKEMLVYEDSLLVCGDIDPLSVGNPVVFVGKVNESGSSTLRRFLEAGTRVRYFGGYDEYPYLIYEQAQLGKNFLVELNPFDLSARWKHPLNAPSNFLLTGAGVARFNGKVVVSATLYGKKYPNDAGYGESNMYLEGFDIDNASTQYRWQRTFEDTGTSYVLDLKIREDGAENIWLVSTERSSPEYYPIPAPPTTSYLNLVDKDGTVRWSRPVPYPSAWLPMQFDAQNNGYYFSRTDFDTDVIYKFSPDGTLLDSLTGSGLLRFEIKGDKTLAISQTPNGMRFLTGLTTQGLDTLYSTSVGDKLPVATFVLPNQSAVYTYLHERYNGFSFIETISLYRDGHQLWCDTLSTSLNLQAASFGCDPQNGTLYCLANEHPFTKIVFQYAISGLTNTYTLGEDSEGIRSLFVNNEGVVVFYEKKIGFYTPEMSLIKYHLLSEQGGVKSLFSFGGGYVLTEDSVATFFRRNGEMYAQARPTYLAHPVNDYVWSDKGYVYIANVFGSHYFKGTGYWFGWRWFRGRVGKFDFREFLDASSAPLALLWQTGTFIAFPNPTMGHFTVETPPHLLQKNSAPIRISVFDSNGRLVSEILTDKGGNQVELDLTNAPSGIYQVEIALAQSSGSSTWGSVVKI